jgi:hypothetical protein
MSEKCQLRTMRGSATRSHFGTGGTTNSGISLTFDLIEFEMKHCASALSMISRVRSSSASPFTVIRGRTVTSVILYLPSTFSSRPSASLSYLAGVRPRAGEREERQHNACVNRADE